MIFHIEANLLLGPERSPKPKSGNRLGQIGAFPHFHRGCLHQEDKEERKGNLEGEKHWGTLENHVRFTLGQYFDIFHYPWLLKSDRMVLTLS